MARFRPHRMYPGALLAQEACSYQGATELLARLRGRLSVIIHSDRDCSNVLPKTGGRVHADLPYKFVCTNMKEDELVTGQGAPKLRQAIELVHAAWQPDLIVVLSTCPTVMIGDNVKGVARKASRDLKIRVEAEVTHGLRPVSPAEVVDTVYSLLARASMRTLADVSDRVNLVGIDLQPDERAEVAAIFSRMGLQLNAVLNATAGLDDFLRAANAAWVVHPGPNLLIHFAEMARSQWAQTPVEVPLPYGVTATDRFWQAIATATGRARDVLGQVEDLRAPAVRAIAAFREQFADRRLRCAYNIGSVRSFELRRIALEELGELPLVQELGFDCALFIQGPQNDANWQRTAQVLRDLGLDLPFALFPAPGNLRQLIGPGAFDLFYGAEFLRDQTSQLNLPLLSHHAPGLGYGQVPHTVAMVQQTLSSSFYQTFQAREVTADDANTVVRLARPSALLAHAEPASA